MSVLQKIREKSGLLLIVIGGALVLFILGDLLAGRNPQGDINNIGEVSGEEITAAEFERRYAEMEQGYARRSGGAPIDEATADMLRQQTFDQIVRERIMREQYEETGVIVTDRELYELVNGKNPHPTVRQAFSNPQTGEFDPSVISRYLQSLESDETGQAMEEWLAFERQLKEIRLDEKYKSLINKGLYVPSFMAKQDFIAKNKNAAFNFIAKRYNTVPDSSVTVTDSELKEYLDNNSHEFEQEASRKIEYVSFDIIPSTEDIEASMSDMSELKAEFAVAENDTAFVFDNSAEPQMPSTYSREQLPAMLDSAFFYAEAGYVQGPVLEINTLKLYKLSRVFTQADSAKARHILINIQDGDTASAMAKIDSLKSVIQQKKNFAEVAEKESTDYGSATKGGDLGWFPPGAMVKPFNDAVFNGNIGDMPVVVSQFGIHLIEVLEKSTPVRKIEVAMVEQPIDAGGNTRDQVYSRANEFLSAAKNSEEFDKAAEGQKINKMVADNLKENERTIMGMENSRQVVRWAYQAEEGDVSPAFDMGSRYVIATLRDIKKKGLPDIEDVRPQLEIEVRKEKKAQKFIEELNAAGGSDLNAISSAAGLPVENANGVTFAAYSIPGVGREPAVAGTVFGLKPNVVSNPVKGETGVFVVMPQSFTEVTIPQDLNSIKQQISGMMSNRVNFEIYEVLKEKAGVTDNLGKFY